MSESASIPIVVRSERLPLGDMPWDRFEAFSADLIACLPGIRSHSCHRYGSTGHKQRGIDIYADRDDGTRWAFSNKRYKAYKPADVGKHVAETTYHADRYFILTSTTAGTNVRDAVRLHQNWDIWDAEDICRELRTLADRDSNAARRIVDTHFGTGWRRQFLGLPAVAAFLTSTDYFRPLLERRRLFHHGLDLVGRKRSLQELLEFAVDDQKRIGILPGRGGIGKSRLLRALADELDAQPESTYVRFQVEQVPLDQTALDELPSSPCIVIADDAHRIGDVELLLAYARRRPNLKILLASRPWGLNGIWRNLDRSGFDSREVTELRELGDLKEANVRELARAALGVDREDWIDRLVSATGDCPLLTVIGAKLLADSAVAPELLAQHAEFRRTALTRLCDDAIGQVETSGSANLTRRLLWVLAAVAPLDKDDAETLPAVSKHLFVDETSIRRLLDNLESVGVIVSRGGFFRITPDILADHLLSEACLGTKGRPTGFATQVFREFPKSAAKVLLNLAELDWRVREVQDEGTTLLKEIWDWIEGWFWDGDFNQQANVLDLIVDVANFQPERVLGLVRPIMKTLPSTREEPGGSRSRMLSRLPGILRRCAQWPNHLRECLEHLWRLGGDSHISSASQTDDPLQVIGEIGVYELNKPLRFSQEVADAAFRWSRSCGGHPRQIGILELIKPLFAREIEHHQNCEDGRLTISWHAISYHYIAPIRDRAVQAVRAFVDSSNVTIQLLAIESLKEALSEQGHRQVPNETIDEWADDQIRVLNEFSRLVSFTTQPIIHLRVMEALRFKARYGRPASVKTQSQQVIANIPKTFDFNVTRLLIPASTHFDEWCDEEVTDTAQMIARNTECIRKFKQAVAAEFWCRYPITVGALREIDRRVAELRPVDNRTDPRQFVWDLLDVKPEQAPLIAELILNEPARATVGCFAICMQFVRNSDAGAADQLQHRALDSGNEELAFQVANAFWHRPKMPPTPSEIEVIRRLLAHSNANTRETGIAAIRHVGEYDPSVAISMIHQVEIIDSADELCFLITSGGIENRIATTITDADLRQLLTKFQWLTKLDEGAMNFLRFSISRLPEEVLAFLLRRIQRESAPTLGYAFQSLPFRGLRGVFAPIAGQSISTTLIRNVRDATLLNENRMQMARLFRAVSANYSADGLDVLREWLDSSDFALVSAAVTLLSRVPHDFVFEQSEFVRHAIERATAIGKECSERAVRVLSDATTYGGKTGFAGEPFPRDIRNRDRAAERLRCLQTGTPLYHLYEQIHREAERSINESDRRNRDDGEE